MLVCYGFHGEAVFDVLLDRLELLIREPLLEHLLLLLQQRLNTVTLVALTGLAGAIDPADSRLA